MVRGSNPKFNDNPRAFLLRINDSVEQRCIESASYDRMQLTAMIDIVEEAVS